MAFCDLFAKIGSFGPKTGDFGSFIEEHLKEHVFSIKLTFLANKSKITIKQHDIKII